MEGSGGLRDLVAGTPLLLWGAEVAWFDRGGKRCEEEEDVRRQGEEKKGNRDSQWGFEDGQGLATGE
jgi:hypothetical protein